MGLKEWWNRVNGNTNDPEETGLSEESEERYDDYQEQKADTYVDQRDPGVSSMGDGEFR
jgi:hypothetical protein